MKKSILFFTAGLSLSLGFITNKSYAQASFSPPTNFSGVSGPQSITSADFNLDGKADLAVADGQAGVGSNSVSVLLGNGLGSFAPAVSFGNTVLAHFIISADFNGDGKPDLATANPGSNTISVFLGNGDGTFNSALIDSAGNSPISLVSGDFNGDGKADIATANTGGNSGSVSVLIGDGTGHFTLSTFPAGYTPYSITSGDYNGDGKADLAVACQDISNNLWIFLSNGTGGFATPITTSISGYPHTIITTDFNNDGKADLAVGTHINSVNKVMALIGNGTGNFTSAAASVIIDAPYVVTSADFNSDGKPDLAVTVYSNNSISVLLGDGTGAFGTPAVFNLGNGPYSLTSKDFNGDGTADLAVTNYLDNNISILLNNTAPPTPSICLVTVDSTHTHNFLVWEKTGLNMPAIDSFVVYREITTNNYQRVGAVSKDSMSTFDDFGANPASTGYRYKLKSKKQGIESAFSNYHNTIYLTNTGANFSWTPYQIENNPTPVAAYYIYRDDNSTGNFQTIGFTTGNQFGYTDVNFATYPNASYYVEAMMSGGTCLPTRSGYGSSRSNVKHFGTTGVQRLNNSTAVNIYPNPFDSQTTIGFSEEQKNITLKIMDVVGKEIKTINFSGRQLIIEKGEMPAGIYFLQIQTEQGITSKKLIINK